MTKVHEEVLKVLQQIDFSGTVIVQKGKEVIQTFSESFANRSYEVKNTLETKFAIASGCKLFSAIAICQLVEKGKLTFQTKLSDVLPSAFPLFNKEITIHHLLTHTSGIPDYFDEDEMDDFEELWINRPMYSMRKAKDFLPLFQHLPMKGNVGEAFHYNNAGYIVLGLIIEEVSGEPFDVYVKTNIFDRCQMNDSGYYALDALPKNCATGYIDFEDGRWKTNSYAVPIKGGADGGAFTSAGDWIKLWNSLMKYELLSEETTKKLLTPYINTDDDYDRFYGYGVWIDVLDEEITKYHVMGYDPGVSFHSAYYPQKNAISTVCSNKSEGAFDIFKAIEVHLL